MTPTEVRAARAELGMTQAQLADALELARQGKACLCGELPLMAARLTASLKEKTS